MMDIEPQLIRPREKIFQRGVQCLTNRELIAVLLGSGTREKPVHLLADEINRYFENSIPFALSDQALLKIGGLGPAKAAQILSSFELARRFPSGKLARIQSARDVLPYLNDIRSKSQEHMVCLTLNGAGELLEKRVITIGLLNSSQVHPREVFADAITDRAASILLAHNHPSGRLEPSAEDRHTTRILVEAGVLLGIPVLDHIIVTRDDYYSFQEHGDVLPSSTRHETARLNASR